MKDAEIAKKIQTGWLRAIVTFEVVGKPKSHVEEALKQYIDNLRNDSRIIILQEESEDALEHEDGMFSSFSECDVLVKDLETFTWLCVNFSPASIEIIEPDQMSVESRNITTWLNDLLAQIHEISMNFRSQKAANEHLTIAMNQMIQNAILLSLRGQAKTGKEMETDIGIVVEQLQPFLDHLVKKQKIVDLKHSYALADAAHASGVMPSASYETTIEPPKRSAKKR